MLRVNELLPTKHCILRGMIAAVVGWPTAKNLAVGQDLSLRELANPTGVTAERGSKTTGWWIACCSKRAIHRSRLHLL